MNWLKELTRMASEAKKRKYPNMPHHAIVPPKYSDSDANGLTRCILDFFHINDYYAVRINTQGQYREGLGWTKSSTKRGTADIHAIVEGEHISVEVKIGRDRLSEEQEETQRLIELAGGTYIVARDFQSFCEELIEKRGIVVDRSRRMHCRSWDRLQDSSPWGQITEKGGRQI
jgi:hypothetical protein